MDWYWWVLIVVGALSVFGYFMISEKRANKKSY